MSMTMMVGAVSALIFGIILYATSQKQREDNGEWSGALQWGYLLMMVGVFGLLSYVMSFTAVLLLFVLLTGAVWLWHKQTLRHNAQKTDDNHFTDYMSGFFPIILIVFVLRTFVAEPFQIPSSSMRPGLVVGDFILVNKFTYGIRVPIINTVLLPTGQVERGDVAVFNYPVEPHVNYIKRIIGLPGDTISYKNKVLSVNGVLMQDTDDGQAYHYVDNIAQAGSMAFDANLLREKIAPPLGDKQYGILIAPQAPSVSMYAFSGDPEIRDYLKTYPYRDHCRYASDGSGFECKVPAGQYFALGDNRDNSQDSRYWGFIDDKLIVGKAFLVWMNFKDMSRIGTRIQ